MDHGRDWRISCVRPCFALDSGTCVMRTVAHRQRAWSHLACRSLAASAARIGAD